eukprot:m.3917 g.3917  ORF g.3917 m.3917 type:complete len:489 (-) comp4348_c0_seq1:272-1738(-)
MGGKQSKEGKRNQDRVSGGASVATLEVGRRLSISKGVAFNVPDTGASVGGVSTGDEVIYDHYRDLNPDAPKLTVRDITRRATAHNPWKSVRHRKSRRPQKHVFGDLSQLLDPESVGSPWYLLRYDRDLARALLENNADKLKDGTFVVTTAYLDFASLCLLLKGRLMNIPIRNGEKGLQLALMTEKKKSKEQPWFTCLSEMIAFYAKQRRDGMPCALLPDILKKEGYSEVLATSGIEDTEQPEYDTATEAAVVQYDQGGDDHAGPDYEVAQVGCEVQYKAPSRRSGQSATPATLGQYDNTGQDDISDDEGEGRYQAPGGYDIAGHSDPQYLPTDEDGYVIEKPEPGDDGFIRISEVSFDANSGINGVSFEPLHADQWFFVGLSNTQTNFHGKRDQHYDDIDYCIFCMGNGLATARECEDEIGPYVTYRAGDSFQIEVQPTQSAGFEIVYKINGKPFFASRRVGSYPLWVAQAFHPDYLNKKIIQNVKWV